MTRQPELVPSEVTDVGHRADSEAITCER